MRGGRKAKAARLALAVSSAGDHGAIQVRAGAAGNGQIVRFRIMGPF
jgi:hypothetical protein